MWSFPISDDFDWKSELKCSNLQVLELLGKDFKSILELCQNMNLRTLRLQVEDPQIGASPKFPTTLQSLSLSNHRGPAGAFYVTVPPNLHTFRVHSAPYVHCVVHNYDALFNDNLRVLDAETLQITDALMDKLNLCLNLEVCTLITKE